MPGIPCPQLWLCRLPALLDFSGGQGGGLSSYPGSIAFPPLPSLKFPRYTQSPLTSPTNDIIGVAFYSEKPVSATSQMKCVFQTVADIDKCF